MKKYLPLTSALALGLTLTALSCSSTPTCDAYGTCTPSGGGTAGTSAAGGASAGAGGVGAGGTAAGASGGASAASGNGGHAGTATGGDTSGGTSSGAAGMTSQAGAAGAAGAAPCDGKCTGTTPVCDVAANACVECVDKSQCATPKPACDTATNTCVACTGDPDCTDTTKSHCDKTAEQCVACLQQSDCKDASASKCAAGACTPCTADAECSNITGKGVCAAGTCVQCSVLKESACSGKSCNPATNACTTTTVGSVATCKPCLADSECVGGNQADPDARCVPMKFMGVARPGGFCLTRVAKTCSQPYKVPISASSLSGAVAETYCGIDQDSTRCEAVLDLTNSRSCPDGKDTSCGCTRDKNGVCTDSGEGGLCKTVGVDANQCTYSCGVTNQCPSGLTCPGVPYCH